MKKFILIILILIFNFQIDKTFTQTQKKELTQITELTDSIVNNKLKESESYLFDITKEEIKRREGLRLTRYNCPAGQETIGYGHLIKPGENIPYKISIEQADSLLNKDMQIIINYLKKEYNLKGYRLFAIVSFSFNFGMFYMKIHPECKLDSLIRNNLPIDEEILKYFKYRNPKTKQMVESKHLLNARIFERNLYKKEDSLYNFTFVQMIKSNY